MNLITVPLCKFNVCLQDTVYIQMTCYLQMCEFQNSPNQFYYITLFIRSVRLSSSFSLPSFLLSLSLPSTPPFHPFSYALSLHPLLACSSPLSSPTLSLCLSLSSLWNTYSFFLLFPTLYLLIITVECQNETHDVIIDLSSTLHLRHIIATFFFSNLLFWIIILILNCKYRIKFLIYTLQFVNVKSYFAVQSVIFTFYVSLYSYLQFGQLAAKDIVISNRFK